MLVRFEVEACNSVGWDVVAYQDGKRVETFCVGGDPTKWPSLFDLLRSLVQWTNEKMEE